MGTIILMHCHFQGYFKQSFSLLLRVPHQVLEQRESKKSVLYLLGVILRNNWLGILFNNGCQHSLEPPGALVY